MIASLIEPSAPQMSPPATSFAVAPESVDICIEDICTFQNDISLFHVVCYIKDRSGVLYLFTGIKPLLQQVLCECISPPANPVCR